MRVVLWAILMLLWIEPAAPVEKYWIAQNADAVIIGQLLEVSAVRTSEGWRFRGILVAEEVLFGPVILRARIVCSFTCSCCPTLPPPPIEWVTKDKGLGKVWAEPNRRCKNVHNPERSGG